MKLIIFFCLFIMLLPGCTEDKSFTTVPEGYSRGRITGIDTRMCPSPCCGGWFITISDSAYHMASLPADSHLDLSDAHYPVDVFLKWEMDTTVCSDNEIRVLDIRKQ